MTSDDPAATRLRTTADADLVLRTRSGDREAYAELWRRHYRSGATVARAVSSSLDPDDLVQEAYARIYQAILKGGGPTGSFRAYLFTSIRNTAATWGRGRREVAIDELDAVEDPSTGEQAAQEALDRGITARAFRCLPTRWQEVLWYTEIEQLKPAEVAPLLGLKAAAVAQLAFRAREGLREAWIQAHLQSVRDGSECQWTIERLGAYSRANLGRRDHGRVEDHLAGCARCAIVAAEAREVSHRLALVLLPLLLGATGATAYLASLQGGGVATLALAAGTAPAMPGAVTVVGPASGAAAGAGSAGAGSGAGASGAGSGSGAGASGAGSGSGSGASGAGAATGGSTGGGILSGTGAVTAFAVAATVIVGAVVAATVVLPSMTQPPQSAADAASRSGSGSIDELIAPATGPAPADAPQGSTDATPGESVDPAPGDPAPVTPAPPGPDAAVPPADPAHPAAPETPAQPAPPTEPATPGPGDGAEIPPTQPVEPTAPPEPEPPAVDALPEGVPSPGRAAPEFSGLRLTLHVPVSGAAGSTVEVLLAGTVNQRIVLDGAGAGTASIRPTLVELLADARVGLRYVTATSAGPTGSTRLSDLVDLRALRDALRD